MLDNTGIVEEVINISLGAGETYKSDEVKTSADGTEVIAVVVFTSNLNDAFIDLAIEAGGHQVSKSQNILNYRSRETGYLDNKPCYFESGQVVRWELKVSTGALVSAFKAQIILIKRKRSC